VSETTKPRRLGRGLSSLIGEPVQTDAGVPVEAPSQTKQQRGEYPVAHHEYERLRAIPVEQIVPAPSQPRQTFTESALAGLVESIKTSGVMQPVAVRPMPMNAPDAPAQAKWELVAGERRWRAAQQAGLTTVPAIIAELDDRQAAEWSLIENLQRVDLNPMERAWAFRRLSEQFALSHSQISQRIGLDRTSVANLVRLTELEPEIREQLANGDLSTGHGKALLAMPPGPARVARARRAADAGWSVRRLEQNIRSQAQANQAETHTVRQQDRNASGREPTPRDAARRDLERRLQESFGTKVELHVASNGQRGRLVIHFFDLDQFDGLLAQLTGAARWAELRGLLGRGQA